MTTMSHDDAAGTTALEDALDRLDDAAQDLGSRARRSHLAAVGPRGPRPATAPVDADASGAAHGPRTPARAPGPHGGTRDVSHRRLRLVPALEPVRPRTAPVAPVPPLLTERVRHLDELARTRAPERDDDRGRAPLADAGRFAHGVGLACVEVVLGRRPAQQLARWVTAEVLQSLQERADLVRRAGVLTHARRPVARRVRVCPVDEHAAEVCLVVDDGARVRAVALRLDAWRGAWRVTTLEIG